jgi:hypothetical protein
MKYLVYMTKYTGSASKKYTVVVYKNSTKIRTIHFGQDGSSDYTKHKDYVRMKKYLYRHRSRENWTKSGITTAGFWSRWLLWSEPTISKAINLIENKFNIDIKRGVPPKR